MEKQDIKSLTPIECPHCNKPIMVEITNSAPTLTGTYTVEMLQSAKKEALAKIAELGLPSEETLSTIEWINNENTIFAPSDVDEIIKNIKENGEIHE